MNHTWMFSGISGKQNNLPCDVMTSFSFRVKRGKWHPKDLFFSKKQKFLKQNGCHSVKKVLKIVGKNNLNRVKNKLEWNSLPQGKKYSNVLLVEHSVGCLSFTVTHLVVGNKRVCLFIVVTSTILQTLTQTHAWCTKAKVLRTQGKNTHSSAALLKPYINALLLLPARDCWYIPHYWLATCALANWTVAPIKMLHHQKPVSSAAWTKHRIQPKLRTQDQFNHQCTQTQCEKEKRQSVMYCLVSPCLPTAAVNSAVGCRIYSSEVHCYCRLYSAVCATYLRQSFFSKLETHILTKTWTHKVQGFVVESGSRDCDKKWKFLNAHKSMRFFIAKMRLRFSQLKNAQWNRTLKKAPLWRDWPEFQTSRKLHSFLWRGKQVVMARWCSQLPVGAAGDTVVPLAWEEERLY